MSEISGALVNAYIAKRRGMVTTMKSGRTKPAAPETINRELTWLKQMFRLAIDAGKLMTRPKISLLPENNARQGLRGVNYFCRQI